MSEEAPTVFVVDDDESMRDSLDSLLRSVGLKTEVFPSATDFLQSAPSEGPACLILDVRLPGLSGLDLQAELKRLGIEIPIIFLTGHGDIPMSVRAMKAGATEFLTKPFREQELLDAVGQALARDRERRRLQSEIAGLSRRYEKLTPREREVMELVVAGMLNKQIAFELGVSEVTVKLHRGQAMHKMQSESVADLVRMSEKLGLPAAKH
jgi:FixJ family two-component response regulator